MRLDDDDRSRLYAVIAIMLTLAGMLLDGYERQVRQPRDRAPVQMEASG